MILRFVRPGKDQDLPGTEPMLPLSCLSFEFKGIRAKSRHTAVEVRNTLVYADKSLLCLFLRHHRGE